MRPFAASPLSAAALAAASLAVSALPARAADPLYVTEARCLGIYEAGYFIFSRVEQIGPAAGAGALIAGAVNGAAKMSYEQTIEGVIARDDMDDDELATFRAVHMASSETVVEGYAKGDLDLFQTGQLIYECDVALGYTEDHEDG